MQRAFNVQMVVQMNKKQNKTRCVMVNELSNSGQGFHPLSCIYSLWIMMGKSLDPTLNIHISCYITDTVEGCKPMNQGHLWICLVGITPSNNPGTERELLPYMVGNSLIWSWVTPLVMEYNSRAMEYYVIIFVKDYSYFNNPSGHQICLNNLIYHAILMET